MSVAGVVFVECLYALWTASRGYFWQDDFIDLGALRQLGFGGRLLEQPVFGHFIPGFTLVDYMISLVVPYQWWLIVPIEVLLFGLSLFLLDHLLVTLFGRSWPGVVLVAIAGASFSLVPSLVWWATALEYLVAIPATLLACIFHVRYLRTGRIRNAIFGAISIGIGLAFYDGLFVSVLFIVLMTVLIWPVGPGLHGVAATLVEYWRAWTCYAIPVVLELGWRFAHPGLYVTGGTATIGQVLGFVGLSWTQTVVPLIFGVDAWVLPVHAERVVAGLLGQLLFWAFVVGTILRRSAAWRAWVLFGSTFLVGAGLVGATRAGTYGPGDASDVKYVALDAFFLVIAIGFALWPVRPTSESAAAPRAESGGGFKQTAHTARPAWFGPTIAIITVALVLVYGTALVFDQGRDAEAVGSHASNRFFAIFAASWAAETAGANHPYLWDTEINPKIVTRAFFPYDTASVTVGRLHPEIRFDQWGGTGYLLRSNGSVVRAKTVTLARGLTNGRARCAAPQHEAGALVLTLNHPLDGARQRFALVSYQSATGAVVVQSNGGSVVFPKGTHTLITGLPPTPFDSLVWHVQRGSRLCITGLRVVVPAPLTMRIVPSS